ncbi:hypothetical protein V6N13_004910 [Hibiscus sabdariffa]|uniref:Uncharacterized protein n=1 Tax=Hibiscus sabdariffa TaxID=183260 RepID=A0ABR2S0Q6_9ROSI
MAVRLGHVHGLRWSAKEAHLLLSWSDVGRWIHPRSDDDDNLTIERRWGSRAWLRGWHRLFSGQKASAIAREDPKGWRVVFTFGRDLLQDPCLLHFGLLDRNNN